MKKGSDKEQNHRAKPQSQKRLDLINNDLITSGNALEDANSSNSAVPGRQYYRDGNTTMEWEGFQSQ